MTGAEEDVRLKPPGEGRRQVLVFTPLAGHPDYRWQMAALAAAGEGVAARGVAVLEVRGESTGTLDGSPLSPGEVRRLREEHRVGPGSFLVVLVGADGTERFRTNAPTPPARLFGLLDSMPLRHPPLQETPAP